MPTDITTIILAKENIVGTKETQIASINLTKFIYNYYLKLNKKFLK